EIAATLGWPLQAVRNCTDALITWVLDELGASGRTPSEYLPAPPPPVGSEKKDARAPPAYQPSDDDEHDAVEHGAADQRDDPTDDEDRRDDPQDRRHASPTVRRCNRKTDPFCSPFRRS